MGKRSKNNKNNTWLNKVIYGDNGMPDAKKPKLDDEKEWDSRKKKVVMMLMYNGKGYLGMQKNHPLPTIEKDLLESFVKAGIVRPDHIEQPSSKMGFQRAARTDKGVSAAGQIVSFKMLVDVEDTVTKINQNLPEQIRVFGWKKVTKGFDCKNSCSARTYTYTTPTFAFAPIEEITSESYRISNEVLQNVQNILDIFCGTRNFHNYTSRKKSTDSSAYRYMMDFKVGESFIRDDVEYVVLKIKGQSFMLHQIRKMTGMVIAVLKGYATVDTIKKSWMHDKLDIPKAPALGLVLNEIHYDCYNKRFGSDGIHQAIEWSEFKDQMEEFKDNRIYSTIYNTEKEEKSMLKWLGTLPLHHYGVIGQEPDTIFDAYALARGDNPRKSYARGKDADEEVVKSDDDDETLEGVKEEIDETDAGKVVETEADAPQADDSIEKSARTETESSPVGDDIIKEEVKMSN